jgi:hypothetical protein
MKRRLNTEIRNRVFSLSANEVGGEGRGEVARKTQSPSPCPSPRLGGARFFRTNLRFEPLNLGTVPGIAGVSPASSGFRLPTGRRDAGAPRRFRGWGKTSCISRFFRVHPSRIAGSVVKK